LCGRLWVSSGGTPLPGQGREFHWHPASYHVHMNIPST
jgi:hypothetical protein